MSEPGIIVMNWRNVLRAKGWPEEEVTRITTELLTAGYQKCILDAKALREAQAERDEALIQKAVRN